MDAAGDGYIWVRKRRSIALYLVMQTLIKMCYVRFYTAMQAASHLVGMVSSELFLAHFDRPETQCLALNKFEHGD